eukprot:513325-Amphidinium_carterae.1
MSARLIQGLHEIHTREREREDDIYIPQQDGNEQKMNFARAKRCHLHRLKSLYPPTTTTTTTTTTESPYFLFSPQTTVLDAGIELPKGISHRHFRSQEQPLDFLSSQNRVQSYSHYLAMIAITVTIFVFLN